MHEQLQGKQEQFRDRIHKLEEELQVEKDNGLELDKVRGQRDNYMKTIASLKEGMEQFQEVKAELENKNDQIK